MVNIRSSRAGTPARSQPQTQGSTNVKRGKGRPRNRAVSAPASPEGKGVQRPAVKRVSKPVSRLEVYITTHPESLRSKQHDTRSLLASPPQVPGRSLAPDLSRSALQSTKTKATTQASRPAIPIQSAPRTRPTAKPAPIAEKQTSLSTLQSQVTAALKTPERPRASTSASAALKRKRSLSQIAPKTSPKNKNQPKPSILSFGTGLREARPSVADDTVRRSVSGATFTSSRPAASRSVASSAARRNDQKLRRSASATGLLTPAASTSVHSGSHAEPRATPLEHEGSINVDDIPSPVRRKDKGKQRAVEPPSPGVSSVMTPPQSPSVRATKRSRLATPYPNFVVNDDDDEGSKEDGDSEGDDDEPSGGFQMMNFSDVWDIPRWTPVDPRLGNKMYVPQGVTLIIENMNLTLEAEAKARKTAETAFASELQRSAQSERRVAELEAEKNALLERLQAQEEYMANLSLDTQMRLGCACQPEEREKWIQQASDDIAEEAAQKTKEILDGLMMKAVAEAQDGTNPSSFDEPPNALALLTSARLHMAVEDGERRETSSQSGSSSSVMASARNKGKGRMVDSGREDVVTSQAFVENMKLLLHKTVGRV